MSESKDSRQQGRNAQPNVKAAEKLVEKLGSVERARQALDTLRQLRKAA